MSEVNIPLLRKAVEWVEEQDAKPGGGHWFQGSWVTYLDEIDAETAQALGLATCGTAYCVAGYIGSLTEPAFARESCILSDKGGALHVSDYARQQLGLNDEQADALFHASNTARDVRQIAEEIAGERL